MPDYFVSIDTSKYTGYYTSLINNGTLVRFALGYVDRNREQILQTFNNFDSFNDNFRVTEEIRKDLTELALKDNIQDNPEEYEISKQQIERALKAYIARDMWSNNEFYEVINSGDEKFRTAVMILDNWDKYEASLLNEK